MKVVCDALNVMIYVTVVSIGTCRDGDQPLSPACRLQIMGTDEEYEYIKEGDLMIGGMLTISSSDGVNIKRRKMGCSM
ncbi:hypothetical protein XELAEV_18004323mg [Xenopus laevis]|uniref:Uncharacterized protein n=1 Tax=Xenopus laevis TaxID=8355 RepID=A0A974GZY2_XENLA|nr:hypothetical protein XELAEV_18004323mg [Xenopus laevis]